MSKEDQRAIQVLARVLYLFYCREKDFTPWDAPRVPRWAIDYAEIAVKSYGYEDQAVDELEQELYEGATPTAVA